jgi:hypothetical protein
MKHIRKYQELFEAVSALSKEQTEWLNFFTNGQWKLNKQTGEVDVTGDFLCSGPNVDGFKGIQFGTVTGNFSCHYGGLKSLQGAPRKVGGYFYCHRNELETLKGAPETIGGDFNCSHNKLVSLEGGPSGTVGSFNCSRNALTSLKGAPQAVISSLDCSHNQLVSLEGAPLGAQDAVFNQNPVTSGLLYFLYRDMSSGLSWPEAVAGRWSEINKESDSILLAPSHPNFTPEEIKGLEAMARLRRRAS